MFWFRYDDSILQRSIYEMNLNSSDGLTHMYYRKQPLIPFGFGLSYTRFTYAWAASTRDALAVRGGRSISTAALASEGGAVSFNCTVRNIGSRSGDAVVLGFVNSSDSAFPRQRRVVDLISFSIIFF